MNHTSKNNSINNKSKKNNSKNKTLKRGINMCTTKSFNMLCLSIFSFYFANVYVGLKI